MKKVSLIYIIAALLAGLILGYLLFRGSGTTASQHEHTGEMAQEQMWTCSMHSWIRQPEPGNCPICGMELIPVEGGGVGLATEQVALTENAMALADIRTTIVGAGHSLPGGLLLSGKIQANEEANVVQASYFAGRIENLYVNTTGETIHKDQRLAMIHSPELVAAQQELLSALSLKTSQPVLYEAVRNKMKLWKLTDSQIDAIETSAKVQDYFPVFATVSGTVTDKMVQEGDYVKQGQPLLRITNLNTVWAVFDAYEQQLPSLKKGQEISITSNAYPNNRITGKITFINPMLDARTRTVEVRAVLENREGLFKPGMFVKGTVTGMTAPDQGLISIPSSAVMWTGERSLVYVRPIPSEPVFEMREVLLGAPSGQDSIQVIKGLSSGEEIVVNGTFTVDAAAQLKGKKSMMNTNGGPTSTSHEGHPGLAPSPTNDIGNKRTQQLLPQSFREAFKNALEPYLLMKDALVAGEPSEVERTARTSLEAFQKLPGLKSNAAGEAMRVQSLKQLLAIAKSDDLNVQREHFVFLNEALVALSKGLEKADKTIYVQHCPMANKNKGAYWLSLEKEIRNPYYGDAMLGCGSTIDSIK